MDILTRLKKILTKDITANRNLKKLLKEYIIFIANLEVKEEYKVNYLEDLKKALEIIEKSKTIDIKDFEYVKQILNLEYNEPKFELYFKLNNNQQEAVKVYLSKIKELFNNVDFFFTKEIEEELYIIPKEYIISHTTPKYRNFLKKANYMDLDSADGLLVEKKIFKRNINQINGRKLVKDQGYKLLTAGIMYLVFIPWLKEKESQGDTEAQETLNEMKSKYAEWLEDQIINKNTLKINNKEIEINLIQQDGRFDKEDINEYGYPEKLKEKGEYYYWYPRNNEIAAIRGRGSELSLDLDRGPGVVDDVLGLRRAKFFNFKKERKLNKSLGPYR